MSYGVTATGFVDKPIEVILSEMETDQKAEYGANFDTTAQSPAGQLNGIMSVHLRELWEVAQAIYTAMDPDSNSGQAQSQMSALTGTLKRAATKSTVTLTVNLDAGKTLELGAVISVDGTPATRFITTADATNSGGSPANVSVAAKAETAGVFPASTGTLTVIETPQVGWNSSTNALDADIGLAVETEEELRIRREVELRRAGAAAPDAIKSDVSGVASTTNATVFENTSLVTDGDGVPGKAIEVVVLGGDDDEIAQAIWDSRAGGIEHHTSSADSGTAVDDDGNNQTIYFSRPDEIRIYATAEVTVDSDYPSDGDTQIKAALAAYAQTLAVGEDLVWSALFPIIFAISGVVDVSLLEIAITPPGDSNENIAISAREIASIDTADVTVVST